MSIKHCIIVSSISVENGFKTQTIQSAKTLGSSCPENLRNNIYGRNRALLHLLLRHILSRITLTTINTYNIRTGFHRNTCIEIGTIFNCLLSSAFCGLKKAVEAIPNLAHLFFAKRLAKNKKAKSCPFKIGVLSAQYCASHSVSVKGASPAAAWYFVL